MCVSVADRIGVGLTLLLTAAMYKLVIADMLPEVAYLTLIDKYTLASCLVITTFLLECACWTARFMDDAHSNDHELLADLGMYFVAGLWLFVQLFFVVISFMRVRASRDVTERFTVDSESEFMQREEEIEKEQRSFERGSMSRSSLARSSMSRLSLSLARPSMPRSSLAGSSMSRSTLTSLLV